MQNLPILFVMKLGVAFVSIYMIIPFLLTRGLGVGVTRKGKARRQIAFTFDDGPNPVYTPQLLRLLREHQVKATFFVLGSKAEKYPALLRQMYEEGHLIGIHNYTHRANWVMTPWRVKQEQVERSAAIIQQITGERPIYYRPPWGILNIGDRLLLGRKYRIVLWSVIAGDWKRSICATRLKDRLLSKIKPGAIVVLHDCGETLGADLDAPQQMLEGLHEVLSVIQDQDYACLRVDELLEQKAEVSHPHHTVSRGHMKSG